LNKTRIYYGWVVALASAALLFAMSNFQYSFGVFVRPLVDTFGWTRGEIAGIASVRSVVFGVLSPFTGSISDKHGPRNLALASILVAATGYFLAASTSALWQAYLFLGVFTGLASGLAYPAVLSTVSRWFPGRSSLANGIVLSGFGLAQVALPPAITFIIGNYGWAASFLFLGGLALAVGFTARYFIRRPPATEAVILTSSRSPTPGDTPTVSGAYTLRQATRTRRFWIIFAVYLIYAMCFQMVAVHIAAAAIDAGITAESAALILATIGISNIVGRLTIGWVAARIGERASLIALLAIQAPALFLLAISRQEWILYALAVGYGFAYGSLTPLVPTILSDEFGQSSLGATFGAINSAYSAGMAVGPWLAGYLFDQTGSYQVPFLIAGIAMSTALVVSFLLKPGGRQGIASV